MTLPQQKWIELPLLLEMECFGGQMEASSRIYDLVARHFPDLTPADMALTRPSTGVNVWENNVQWARNRLRAKGELDGGTRGIWQIATQGRTRLRRDLVRLGIPSGEVVNFIRSRQTIPEKVGDRWRPEALKPRTRKQVPPVASPRVEVQPPPVETPLPEEEREPGGINVRLLHRLHEVTPTQFEHLVARILEVYGFAIVRSEGGPGDRTIDGECLAPLTQLKTAYQAKRLDPSASVDHRLVQQFLGSVRNRGFSSGIYVTTGKYTGGARDEERLAGGLVRLVDGEELVKLLLEKRLGVKDVVMQAEIDEEFLGSLG